MNYVNRKLLELLPLFIVLSGLVGMVSPVLVKAAGTETVEQYGNVTVVTRHLGEWGNSPELYKKINKLDPSPVMSLRVPVLIGVSLSQIPDTWGDARARGRTHEGTDILAPRGSFVVSPTDAVVVKVGYGTIGGNYVFTANPGGEQYYYAHLDSIPTKVKPGLTLKAGDLIGYVGNTGNASGGPTHLHFGIYKDGKATNPFPRLATEFSLKERVKALQNIIANADNAKTEAQIVAKYKNIFDEAKVNKITLNKGITKLLDSGIPAEISTPRTSEVSDSSEQVSFNRDLTLGSQGSDVKALQDLLIKENTGPAASALVASGATGYFGSVTKNALSEYQAKAGIFPASGYFGSLSRASLATSGALAIAS